MNLLHTRLPGKATPRNLTFAGSQTPATRENEIFPLRNTLALLGCLVLLASGGCGWQMRGAFQNTDQLGSIYVDGPFKNDAVGKSLRHDVAAAGGGLADYKLDADHVIWIGNLERWVRTASYDVLVRAIEKELIMRVVFEVRTSEGLRVYGPEQIYAERVYEYDVQGVTNSAAQQTVIERELKEQIGRQIAQRLTSLEPDELAPLEEETVNEAPEVPVEKLLEEPLDAPAQDSTE